MKNTKETLKLWEQIACSELSIELAIEDYKKENIYTYAPQKYYFTNWKTRDWKYIVEQEDWILAVFEYIAKIPRKI